jgi:hypothetical protein
MAPADVLRPGSRSGRKKIPENPVLLSAVYRHCSCRLRSPHLDTSHGSNFQHGENTLKKDHAGAREREREREREMNKNNAASA